MEISFAATTMKSAEERHKARFNLTQDAIAEVEDVQQEDGAAKLLALQTKLQASTRRPPSSAVCR